MADPGCGGEGDPWGGFYRGREAPRRRGDVEVVAAVEAAVAASWAKPAAGTRAFVRAVGGGWRRRGARSEDAGRLGAVGEACPRRFERGVAETKTAGTTTL